MMSAGRINANPEPVLHQVDGSISSPKTPIPENGFAKAKTGTAKLATVSSFSHRGISRKFFNT